MGAPVRSAFCPVFFGAHGGQFTKDTNLPVMVPGVRGLCNRPWDCGSCSFMKEWIGVMQVRGWIAGWECDDCLKKTESRDEADGLVGQRLPGFYQAGRLPCADRNDLNYDNAKLEGCTRCGHETSFLQLVLRRSVY